jgi:hypothetical protein
MPTLRRLIRACANWVCPKCGCHNVDGDVACAYCND